MLKVIAPDFIRPESVPLVQPLCAELVRLTRTEPLCTAYDLYWDQKDPGRFLFIEEWPDRAALAARCATEPFRRLAPLVIAHARQAGSFRLMDAFTLA